jgi:hypothetical protein
MRRICATAVVLLGTTVVAAGPDDGSISKLLVGRWTNCIGGGSATEPDGTIHYDRGGAFVAEGKVALGGGTKADVKVEGTWKVDGGSVVHTVTKSSHPGLAPVGGVLKEHVVSIDEMKLRVRRGVGKERERERVAE